MCGIVGVYDTESRTGADLNQLQRMMGVIRQALLESSTGDRTREMLSKEAIERAGIFDSQRVERLVGKCPETSHFSEVDNMALVGILSSQLVHFQFVEDFSARTEGASCEIDLLIDRRSSSLHGRKAVC